MTGVTYGKEPLLIDLNDEEMRFSTDQDLDPLKEQWELVTEMGGETRNKGNLYTGSYKLQDKNDGRKKKFQSVIIKPDKENSRSGKVSLSRKDKPNNDSKNGESKKAKDNDMKHIEPQNTKVNDSKQAEAKKVKTNDSKKVEPKNTKDNDSKPTEPKNVKDLKKVEPKNANENDSKPAEPKNVKDSKKDSELVDTDKVSNLKKEKLPADIPDNESKKDKDNDKAISELETTIIKPNKEKEKSSSDKTSDTKAINNDKASPNEEQRNADLENMLIPKTGKLGNESNENEREEEKLTDVQLENDQIKDKYLHEIDDLVLQNSPDDLKDERIRFLAKKNNSELHEIIQSLNEIKNSTTDEKTFFDKIADFFVNIFATQSNAQVSEDNKQ